MTSKDKSRELRTIYNAPGVFSTDHARSRPWPNDILRDKSTKTSQHDLNKTTSTDSYFLPGSYDFKNDLKDEDNQVWHMYHGKRQAKELGTSKIDKYNKMNGWYGWQKLFSGWRHDPGRGNEKDSVSNPSSDSHGANTWNYQYWTDNMESREQGILLGHDDISFNLNGTARWMSPIGLQFKWHNYHNHNLASRMWLYNLWLIYTDIWAPSRALYAPIILDGQFTNRKSFTRGVDLLGRSEGDQAKLADFHYSGEVVGFVDEDSMDIIKDKYTISACIGIAHRDFTGSYNSAKYPKWRSWWDVQYLHTDEFIGSEIIIPEPFLLKEKLQDRKLKLL